MYEPGNSVYPELHPPEKPVVYHEIRPHTLMPAAPAPLPYVQPIVKPAAPPVKGVRGFFKSLLSPNPIFTVAAPLPTAPPTDSIPVDTTDVRLLSVYQDLAQHAPVDKLMRAGLDVQKLKDEKIGLNVFYDAKYTLEDVRRFVGTLEELGNLGCNKHFFGLDSPWNIKQLSLVYSTDIREIADRLQMNADDLSYNLTVKDFIELGYNMDRLVKMGAGFSFLMRLQITPSTFASMGGKMENIVEMNLSENQKLALEKTHAWGPGGMHVIPGMTPHVTVSLWRSPK